MSNCFDIITRKPALAVGLSVLTLGILPIGYLGYRLVQWISHTELFAKVSDCFKKYCCCCFPSQQNQANSRLVGNSDNEIEDSDAEIAEERIEERILPEKRAISVSEEPVYQPEEPLESTNSSSKSDDEFDSSAVDLVMYSYAPNSLPVLKPQENLDKEIYKFFAGNGAKTVSGRIQLLRQRKDTFMFIKNQEVQNRILIEILLNGSLLGAEECYEVLDEYLTADVLGSFRRGRFYAAFRFNTRRDYSADLIEQYVTEIYTIFKDGF